MRHLQRTHDVSVKWLSETFRILKPRLKLVNCDTVDQSADIFTKAFDNKEKWNHACDLIGFGGYHPLTVARIPKPPKSKASEANAAAVRQTVIEPRHSRRCSCSTCSDIRSTKSQRHENWKGIDRVIIEYCCYQDSLMGRSIPQSEGCKVIRVTQEHDMTTKSGLL